MLKRWSITIPIDATIAPIEMRLRAEMKAAWGEDWCARWNLSLPEYFDLAGDINALEILRLWTYAKSLDLVEWGKMRYNLLGNAGHWFPGQNAGELDEARLRELAPLLQNNPFADRIPAVLHEAHGLLIAEQAKRLSESD